MRAVGDKLTPVTPLSSPMMQPAAQVILAFSCCFWPRQLFDVVCTDCFIPEFWCTRYPATGPVSDSAHTAPRSPAPAGALQDLTQPLQPAVQLPHRSPAQAGQAAGSSEQRLGSGPAFNATPELPTSLQQSPCTPRLGRQSEQPSRHSRGAQQQHPHPSGQQQRSDSHPAPSSTSTSTSGSSDREFAAGTGDQVYGLVGFACGRRADEASRMGPPAVVSAALHQLDSMYGKPCLLCAQHILQSSVLPSWTAVPLQ